MDIAGLPIFPRTNSPQGRKMSPSQHSQAVPFQKAFGNLPVPQKHLSEALKLFTIRDKCPGRHG